VPVRRIGEGGFGFVDEVEVVASACDLPIGSRWARKRLHAKWASDPTAQARLDREIEALQSMVHENIVSCDGHNLPGEERFYLMPIFSNSLRLLVAGGSKVGDWRFAAAQGVALADALAYAHDRNFVHRDIKPENLLFNANGPLTITDWGLGGFVHQHSRVLTHLTRGGMGTKYYCSVEQWANGTCDARTDIYALGMTLDELVTGVQRRLPAVGAGLSRFAPISSEPGVRALHAVLVKMTALTASGRLANMRAVAAELRRVHGGF
jgi:serine/threonine-protein kinase